MKTTLSLPKKVLPTDAYSFEKTNPPTANSSQKASKQGALFIAFIERRERLFIQMRSGAGYAGLPTRLDGQWLHLVDAVVFGSSKKVKTSELLVRLGDFGGVAHVHPEVDVDVQEYAHNVEAKT